jgi:tRNA G18 (ribose-2'-O)-methylase SpoU
MNMHAIESLDDPRVAAYRNVRDADLRLRDGLFLTEGRLNVKRQLTGSRYPTRSVFGTDVGLRAIQPALERLGDDTPVYVAAKPLLSAVVGYAMHRGCLAVGERGREPEIAPFLADLVARDLERPLTLLVLEDVSNPENVGAVFRNALALGADAVVLTRRCVDPLYRRSIRVSMGASLRLPYARALDASNALGALSSAGFTSFALTTAAGAAPIEQSRKAPRRLALWVGSEGSGLSDAVLSRVEQRVAIPMAPGADSLNVATASGIALHHYRALREQPR